MRRESRCGRLRAQAMILGVTVLLASACAVLAQEADQPAGNAGAAGQSGSADADAQAESDDARAQSEAAAQQEAQMGLRSESYQLFAIGGSGVSGTLNVTEKVGGGTTFVITAVGISPGLLYQPVLFAGDCGPDREVVAELAAVGTIPEDPFASISDVSVAFEQVAEGDYFLYLYPEGGEGDPLACGEVGQGANR